VALSLFVVLVLAFLAYHWSYSAARGTWSARKVPLLAHASVSIAPGVYLLGSLSPSAVYVLESSAGLVLVDSGLDTDASALKWEMARAGLDWTRICAVLLTHAHGDHSGGAQWLRQSTGARVYAGEGDAAVLRAGTPREAFFSTFVMPGHEGHATTVDVALKGGETLNFGDIRLDVLAMPGHTPGSTCYLLTRGSLRALFAGDVIMMLKGDDNPRSELGKPLGTYSAYLSPRYRGDAEDSLASLRRLRGIPVPTLVLPGHPAADPAPASPCLSQARWEELLDRGINDMETLLGRYRADGRDFLDGEPKTILPDLYYLGDFQDSAVYGFFASSKFFIVDAPGGNGFSQFLKSRLEQLGRTSLPPTAVLLTSCGASSTMALKELVEQCHTQVVTSPAGIEKLRESCPPATVFLSTDELSGKGWFPVVCTPLEGPGIAPVAYQLEWSGKKVFFAGRVPAVVNQRTAEKLISQLSRSPRDLRVYFADLAKLLGMKPDVWLPAAATDDQNANLYDDEWQKMIEDNLLVVKMLATGSRVSSQR
jgi:glyoxylase-like metal-dependent hydrolase (beta-lactamase superfamily II)